MQNQETIIQAAIDIGSNTIHIVVARCSPTSLEILHDEQEMVRIGESVTSNGEISAQKIDETISLLSHYKTLASQYTSTAPLVIATEAIRKARNNQQFLAAIHSATNLNVHIIDGTIEALLTFYGATYELYQELSPPSQVAVLDLGGGSMELVTASNQQVTWHTSVPLGSGWLHDRYLQSDPPSLEDLEVAHTFLDTYIAGLHLKQHPFPTLIATGGSANSLLLLARRALNLPEQETRLTYEQIVRCEHLLSNHPAEEISQRYAQPLKRARILPAGALIIHALMVNLLLGEIRISTHGIREGALLAYARYGDHWLHHLQKNAQSSPEEIETNDASQDEQQEIFIQSGARLLLERTHKMLEGRSDVLKHKDIEPVHKMRVASRRLRAVLDAYEVACDPKRFKKVYRQVKEIADILGNARDTDVMVANLQQQLALAPEESQPALQWLIERLSTYRQAHQKKLEAFLQTIDEDAFVQQIVACLLEGETRHGKS